jgi:hypothetical protein
MLFRVIDGIQQAQHFVDVSSQVEVIDRGVLQNSILVDDEQATQCNTLIEKNAVMFFKRRWD